MSYIEKHAKGCYHYLTIIIEFQFILSLNQLAKLFLLFKFAKMGGKCKHELENTNEFRVDAKVAKVFCKLHLLEFFEQIKGHNT